LIVYYKCLWYMEKKILEEFYHSCYIIHLGSNKMYHDLRELYRWEGMKNNVAYFVFRGLLCQKVNFEHQKSASLIQPFKILKWKWEGILMDFVTGLPLTQRKLWLGVGEKIVVDQVFTFLTMVYRSLLSMIARLSLLLHFGSLSNLNWKPIWILVQPSS